MELKRNDLVHKIINFNTSTFMRTYHKIECEGVQNVPKEGPVLFLAKHQSGKDIMLESLFMNYYCNRQTNWIMKSNLPNFLEYGGGIKIERLQEVRRIKDKSKRREFLEKAKENNQNVFEYIHFLYSIGETLFVHPEGTRAYNEMLPMKKEIIDLTRNYENKTNQNIPIIPVGIEYESLNKFRSKIYLRSGEPISTSKPNLISTIENKIKELSNIE